MKNTKFKFGKKFGDDEMGTDEKTRFIKNMKHNEREMRKLKLFVWTDFDPDYTCGLAVALAETEEEARKLVLKKRGYGISNWGKLHILPLSKKCAFSESGGG